MPYYNHDMIISLGYRVKSRIATNFRRWATERLKEYMNVQIQNSHLHRCSEFPQIVDNFFDSHGYTVTKKKSPTESLKRRITDQEGNIYDERNLFHEYARFGRCVLCCCCQRHSGAQERAL